MSTNYAYTAQQSWFASPQKCGIPWGFAALAHPQPHAHTCTLVRVQFTFLQLPKQAGIGAAHLPCHMPRLFCSPPLSESLIFAQEQKKPLGTLNTCGGFLALQYKGFPTFGEKHVVSGTDRRLQGSSNFYFLKEISPVKLLAMKQSPIGCNTGTLVLPCFISIPTSYISVSQGRDFLLLAMPLSRALGCVGCNQSISHTWGTGTGNPCASPSITGSVGSSAAARVHLKYDRQICAYGQDFRDKFPWAGRVGPSLPLIKSMNSSLSKGLIKGLLPGASTVITA